MARNNDSNKILWKLHFNKYMTDMMKWQQLKKIKVPGKLILTDIKLTIGVKNVELSISLIKLPGHMAYPVTVLKS